MKSGFRKTLEGIMQNIVLGGLASATIFAAAACGPKPTQIPTPPPAITQPYTVQGSMAYLGYDKSGKIVNFNVNQAGNRIFNYSPEKGFTAGNILKFDDYSVIIGKGGIDDMYSFASFFKELSQAPSNFGLVGNAPNLGKLGSLTILKNYRGLGDIAVISWEANPTSSDHSSENNLILDAIAQKLGYKNAEDRGNDQPLIVIGPGLDVQTPGNEPRGPNTDYGLKITVYRLNPSGGVMPYDQKLPNLNLLEKIASQPAILARNAAVEEMNVTSNNGTIQLYVKGSYEGNGGTRQPFSGTKNLDELISSGVAGANPVKPLLN